MAKSTCKQHINLDVFLSQYITKIDNDLINDSKSAGKPLIQAEPKTSQAKQNINQRVNKRDPSYLSKRIQRTLIKGNNLLIISFILRLTQFRKIKFRNMLISNCK